MENFDVVEDSYSRSKEDFWLEKHNLQIPIYSFYLSFELTFDQQISAWSRIKNKENVTRSNVTRARILI